MLDASGLAYLNASRGDIEPGDVVPVTKFPTASPVGARNATMAAEDGWRKMR
jgi:hypothetical protein